MAEANPTYVRDVGSETVDYKPLSLMAVAGLALAVLYTALVVLGALAAQVNGEPFFEPVLLGGWAVALPIGGAALSGLALWQIYSSEGTRAGTGLAKWGLGLSLVVGLAYFTYQSFTELAVLQQANRFLLEKDESSGFFPRLQGTDVDVRMAFLYTLGDLADRSVRPESAQDMRRLDAPTAQNPKGLLTQFLESPVVRAFRVAAPGTVKVEPLAVRSWTYENRSYQITRSYRITTDEAVYELPISVSSIEPLGEGEKRRWKVDWQMYFSAPLQPVGRTDLGRKRQGLRQKALEFLNDPKTGWLTSLPHRDVLGVYLGTQPPSEREALRALVAAIQASTPLMALAGAAAVPLKPSAEEQFKSLVLPGYRPLRKIADYFSMDNMRIWDPVFRAKVQDAVKQALTVERLPLLNISVIPDDLAPCARKNGEVLVTHQAQLIPNPFGSPRGALEVLLLLKIVVAAPESLNPEAANAAQGWRVQSVEVDRALPLPRPQM